MFKIKNIKLRAENIILRNCQVFSHVAQGNLVVKKDTQTLEDIGVHSGKCNFILVNNDMSSKFTKVTKKLAKSHLQACSQKCFHSINIVY